MVVGDGSGCICGVQFWARIGRVGVLDFIFSGGLAAVDIKHPEFQVMASPSHRTLNPETKFQQQL